MPTSSFFHPPQKFFLKLLVAEIESLKARDITGGFRYRAAMLPVMPRRLFFLYVYMYIYIHV